MSAATAQTVPFSAKAASQPWSPTDRDRLIFQWIKFDGHKQSWVASQLGMHQTTVSRIVDRYERWIAHGGPSQEGGLSRDERLRAQRWLTYERNEWILNSALRIAGEMEHPTDTSKSTITRSPQSYSQETEVRTQHAVLHRSGLACRYLRLAHRINMDQLQLIEQEPLPDLEPLSNEDLDQSSPLGPRVDSAPGDDREPITVSIPHDGTDVGWAVPTKCGADVVAGRPDPDTPPTEGLPAGCHGHPARADRASDVSPADNCSNVASELAELDQSPATSSKPSTASSPPTHKTHTEKSAESALTDSPINAYDQNHAVQKTQTPAYPVAPSPPESTNPDQSIPFVAPTHLTSDPCSLSPVP